MHVPAVSVDVPMSLPWVGMRQVLTHGFACPKLICIAQGDAHHPASHCHSHCNISLVLCSCAWARRRNALAPVVGASASSKGSEHAPSLTCCSPCRAQLRADARITLAPLVDVLPCLGAVTITMLDAPYFDLSASLIGALDLMSLPGIRDAVQAIAHKVLLQPSLTCSHPLIVRVVCWLARSCTATRWLRNRLRRGDIV